MFSCEHGTRYYDSREAQQYLGISNHVLRTMHNDGYLKDSGYVSVGYLFTKNQLESGWALYIGSKKNINVEVTHV